MILSKKLALSLSKIKTSNNLNDIITGLLDVLNIVSKYDDELAEYINNLLNLLKINFKYCFSFEQQIKHIQYYIHLRDFNVIFFKKLELQENSNIDYKVEKNRIDLIYRFSNNTLTEELIEEYIIDYENSSKKPIFTSIYYELYRHNLHNHYKAMLYYNIEISEKYNQKFRKANCDFIYPDLEFNSSESKKKQIIRLENCIKIFFEQEYYSSCAFSLCKLSLIYSSHNDSELAFRTLNKAKNISKYFNVNSLIFRIQDIESKLNIYNGEFEKAIPILIIIAERNQISRMPYYLVATYYNIGFAFLKLNKFNSSKYYFFKSLILSQNHRYENTLLSTIKSLSELYKSIECYKEALYYNELYSKTKLDIEKNGKIQYFKKLDLLKNYKSKSITDNDFLSKIYKIIDKNISEEKISISFVASNIGMSKISIQRKLKEIKKDSLAKIILKRKLSLAKKIILESSDIKMSEVAYTCGFNSLDVFSRDFKKEFGFSPSVLKSRKLDF